MPPDPAPTLPFPVGLPVRTRGFGIFRCVPGRLPVTLLFRDWDLLWVVGGRLGLRYPDRRLVQAGVGDLAIIPPYQPVEVSELAEGLAYWYCHVAFLPVGEPTAEDPHQADYQGPGAGRELPLLFPAGSARRAITAYRAMTGIPSTSRGWRWQRLVIALFTELARGSPAGAGTGRTQLRPTPDPRLDRMLARIEADPAHPWTVAGLARTAGLSQSHLNALFHGRCGCGPKRFLVEARLRLTLRLLRESPAGGVWSINRIAEAGGFSSQHLFSRQFRASFGITPSAYRAGAGLAT